MKIEIYICKYCGAEWLEEGHCNSCEKLHLDRDELVVSGVGYAPGTDKCYYPKDRLPAILIIHGKDIDTEGTYIKIDKLPQAIRSAKTNSRVIKKEDH